jgi:Ca2+-binding EF-hand superfamily protein
MVCQSLGYGPMMDSILKLVRTKDINGTGYIDAKDFAILINPSYNPFEDNEGIAQAFRSFDYNHSGMVNPDNIKVVADELGENIPEMEREEMVNLFARTHDRAVNFDEFYEIMQLANAPKATS